jgi:hypothetical protein
MNKIRNSKKQKIIFIFINNEYFYTNIQNPSNEDRSNLLYKVRGILRMSFIT